VVLVYPVQSQAQQLFMLGVVEVQATAVVVALAAMAVAAWVVLDTMALDQMELPT
jgi:hypothetical protein